MHLKNKHDGGTYLVRTENDNHDGFMVFAKCISNLDEPDFCMRYRSLDDFNDEWEDA